MTTTATFSALLRTPNEVLEHLNEGDIVLTRRGGESLRLTRERTGHYPEVLAAFSQMLNATVLDETATENLAERMKIPYAWMSFLSTVERQQFVEEFLETARACASVGNFDRLNILVGGWRETATAYSMGLPTNQMDLDLIPGGRVVDNPHVTR